jgi:hypothetical protein
MWGEFIRLLLAPFSMIFGHGIYAKAKKLEKSGKYKEACYTYAIAILNGAFIYDKEIRKKIKNLWIQHGPFNYDEDLKKEIEKHGDTPERCAEAGHAATMSIIEEIIKGK